MQLPFVKMQGAGNDFVMLDGFTRSLELTTELVQRLCDRRFGIGCDQLLVVEKPTQPDCDFRYRIFNQNGGEVQMCGNGARCFVVFVRALGLTDKKVIRCQTMKRVIAPELLDDGRVRVDMGAPTFTAADIPFNPQGLSHLSRGEDTLYEIRTGVEDNWLSVLSMGNPHCVRLVGDVEETDVAEIGTALQKNPAFPESVNAGFLEVLDDHHARYRVYERGVGETLACGTGACAAAVAGMRRGAIKDWAEIECRGGTLRIDWAGAASHVFLTGPARIVYRGEIDTETFWPQDLRHPVALQG